MFIISHINDINEEKYRAIDNRIQNFIKNDFKYISSGGGATLEYIAKGSLPGIDAISDGDNIEILDL